MNIKKILFSFLVIAFGVALFPTFVSAGNIKVIQVDGCLPGDQEGISCVPNKVTQSQEIRIQGSGFRSVDKITLAFKGDQTFEPLPGYDDNFIVANVPSNAKVGARILVVQGFKKQASGGFILSESAEKSSVEVVASGSTSTDSKPPVVGAPASGTDFCAQTKTRYGSDYAKWPTIKVGLNNDAAAVKCAKSLVMKVAPAWELDVNDGNYSEEDAGAITYIQSIQNPPLKDDGVIGKATWPALFAGKFASSGGSGDKPTPLGDCKDFDFVTEKCLDVVAPGAGNGNPKNTDLCGFLGEGYTEKNGLCFPPEVVKGSSGSIVASDSIGTLIRNIMRILLTLAGALAVLFIVIGSVMYTTAEGNEGRAKQGKAIITRAIIGLVGSALAYTIVTIVYNLLTSGSVFSG